MLPAGASAHLSQVPRLSVPGTTVWREEWVWFWGSSWELGGVGSWVWGQAVLGLRRRAGVRDTLMPAVKKCHVGDSTLIRGDDSSPSSDNAGGFSPLYRGAEAGPATAPNL